MSEASDKRPDDSHIVAESKSRRDAGQQKAQANVNLLRNWFLLSKCDYKSMSRQTATATKSESGKRKEQKLNKIIRNKKSKWLRVLNALQGILLYQIKIENLYQSQAKTFNQLLSIITQLALAD